MPIDLQWVRSNPDHVQTWQDQRRRRPSLSTKTSSSSTAAAIEKVQEWDVICRQQNYQLESWQKQLKQMSSRHPQDPRKQQQHHQQEYPDPSQTVPAVGLEKDTKQESETEVSDSNSSRSDVYAPSSTFRADKKAIHAKIQDLKREHRYSLQKRHEALCRLASPIDSERVVVAAAAAGKHHPTISFSTSSQNYSLTEPNRPGWDIYQAMLQYAQCQVFSHYPLRMVEAQANDASPNTRDHFHGHDEKFENDALPSWLHVIQQEFGSENGNNKKKKHVYGIKQLPLYTALLHHDHETTPSSIKSNTSNSSNESALQSFDLLAMTCGTLWDARQAQDHFLDEMENFYRELLWPAPAIDEKRKDDDVSSFLTYSNAHRNRIYRRKLAATELAPHEWSCIELVVEISPRRGKKDEDNYDKKDSDDDSFSSSSRLRLGRVSNFGCAAARACDIVFLGGGDTGHKKEHVHLIHAAVLSPNIAQSLFETNSANRTNEGEAKPNANDIGPILSNKKSVTRIAPCLRPYLRREYDKLHFPDCSSLDCDTNNGGWQEVTTTELLAPVGRKKQQPSPLLGRMMHCPRPAVLPSRNKSKDPKQRLFPLLSPDQPLCKTRQREEALTCTFDFLL